MARAVALACLAGGVLAGCSGVPMPGLPELSIPDNDPAFRTRVYAGAAVGSSRLDPDTGGTVFNVDEGQASASQLRLGVDVHNMLSVELESAVLGSASLREAGAEVDYSSASISAVVYATGGARSRSLREGWAAYGRLGYGTLGRSSTVLPLDGSSTGAVLGLGAEYGFDGGLGIRGELTRYDSEAIFVGLGAVYRFGFTPRDVAGLVGDAVSPVLDQRSTRVGADGRAASAAFGEPSLGAALPAGRRASPSQPSRRASGSHPDGRSGHDALRRSAGDADADGIADAQDLCLGTPPAVSIDRDGCGLFDAVLGDVVFKSGSWWLNARARGALDEVADKLLAFPEVRIEVQAHTDTRGAADLNLALSTRRAEAVLAYLRSRGLSELQLQGVGIGESRPLASNDSEAGRRRNRRIELVTLADLSPEVLAGRALPGSVWHYPLVREAKQMLERKPRPAAPIEPAVPPVAAVTPSASPSADPALAGSSPAIPSLAAALARPGTARTPLPAPGHVAGARLNGVVDGLGFDSGSDRLADGGDAAIATLATALQRHPRARVAVMAHTDGQGLPADNMALSEARAQRVIELLGERGIEPSRLVAEPYGDTLPRVQDLNDAGRAANRRIELRVLD